MTTQPTPATHPTSRLGRWPWLLCAMAKKPAERFATAGEFAARLVTTKEV